MRRLIIVACVVLGAATGVAVAEGMIWRSCGWSDPLTCALRPRLLPLAYVAGLLFVGPLTGAFLYDRADRWRRSRRQAAV